MQSANLQTVTIATTRCGSGRRARRSALASSSMLRCGDGSSFTLLLDGAVLKAGGRDCNDEGQCISNGAAELYVPAGVPLPPL